MGYWNFKDFLKKLSPMTPALGFLTWFDWFPVSVLDILPVANDEADPNYVHLVLSVLHRRPGNCQHPTVGGLVVQGWFNQDTGQRILHLTCDVQFLHLEHQEVWKKIVLTQ